MRTLNIEEQNAITAYNKGTDADKRLLINLFGDKVFNQTITDRVKTFEDALAISGTTQAKFDEDYGKSPQSVAFGKLEVIAKVLNEGWTPDWDNGGEYKYYPWFKLQGGFSFRDVGYDCRSSFVGSRLCFKSSALAKYAGEQFLDIYKAFMVL